MFTLSDKLSGIELRHNALKNLVDNRREDALVVVLAKLAVDVGQFVGRGSAQDTNGDVDHLQIYVREGSEIDNIVVRDQADLLCR